MVLSKPNIFVYADTYVYSQSIVIRNSLIAFLCSSHLCPFNNFYYTSHIILLILLSPFIVVCFAQEANLYLQHYQLMLLL